MWRTYDEYGILRGLLLYLGRFYRVGIVRLNPAARLDFSTRTIIYYHHPLRIISSCKRKLAGLKSRRNKYGVLVCEKSISLATLRLVCDMGCVAFLLNTSLGVYVFY